MADDFNGICFLLATLGGNKKYGKRIEINGRHESALDSKQHRFQARVLEVDGNGAPKLPLLPWLVQGNGDATAVPWLNAGCHPGYHQRRSQLHVFDFKRFRTTIFETKGVLPFIGDRDLAEVEYLRLGLLRFGPDAGSSRQEADQQK